MCQLRAVVQRDEHQETVMESVTGLEVVGDDVVLSTFFEDPLTIAGVEIKKIDFLGGSVLLVPRSASQSLEKE